VNVLPVPLQVFDELPSKALQKISEYGPAVIWRGDNDFWIAGMSKSSPFPWIRKYTGEVPKDWTKGKTFLDAPGDVPKEILDAQQNPDNVLFRYLEELFRTPHIHGRKVFDVVSSPEIVSNPVLGKAYSAIFNNDSLNVGGWYADTTLGGVTFNVAEPENFRFVGVNKANLDDVVKSAIYFWAFGSSVKSKEWLYNGRFIYDVRTGDFRGFIPAQGTMAGNIFQTNAAMGVDPMEIVKQFTQKVYPEGATINPDAVRETLRKLRDNLFNSEVKPFGNNDPEGYVASISKIFAGGVDAPAEAQKWLESLRISPTLVESKLNFSVKKPDGTTFQVSADTPVISVAKKDPKGDTRYFSLDASGIWSNDRRIYDAVSSGVTANLGDILKAEDPAAYDALLEATKKGLVSPGVLNTFTVAPYIRNVGPLIDDPFHYTPWTAAQKGFLTWKTLKKLVETESNVLFRRTQFRELENDLEDFKKSYPEMWDYMKGLVEASPEDVAYYTHLSFLVQKGDVQELMAWAMRSDKVVQIAKQRGISITQQVEPSIANRNTPVTITKIKDPVGVALEIRSYNKELANRIFDFGLFTKTFKERGFPLPKDMVLWRQVNSRDLNNTGLFNWVEIQYGARIGDAPDLKGLTLADGAPLATTPLAGNQWGGDLLFRIHAPKGTKSAPVFALSDAHAIEAEVTLPPETPLKIVKVSPVTPEFIDKYPGRYGAKWIIDAEVTAFGLAPLLWVAFEQPPQPKPVDQLMLPDLFSPVPTGGDSEEQR